MFLGLNLKVVIVCFLILGVVKLCIPDDKSWFRGYTLLGNWSVTLFDICCVVELEPSCLKSYL